MSYKHVGTAGDLVRFGCSLNVECTHYGAAARLELRRRVRVDYLAFAGIVSVFT